MNYRAEIDGLRAIAVVSVIFYHAEIMVWGRDYFQGGFIGVDIFFVISGYLITRIILAELFSKNSFNFLHFYERRARRLLPMLFTVMLVSFPFAWQRLLPNDLIEYSQSILSAIFFGSNFFFYYTTTEYAADSALLKPFLHTWSLGIEEQFYIVFPILLLLFFKCLRSHILTLFVAMFFFSLQLADVMGGRNAELNFYFPLSRFWELLVGSCLAWIELKYGRLKNEMVSSIFPIMGLYLICYSILFFNNNTPHPSFETLLPVLGVALIIAFSSANDLVGKILGSKPLVEIGLISYSAYLWHFPIMAFERVNQSTPSNIDKLIWVFLTFVFSVLSYWLIEKLFRNREKIRAKSFVLITASVGLFIVAVSITLIVQEGFKHRIPKFLSEAIEPSYDYAKTAQHCDDSLLTKCELEVNKDGKYDVFLVSDSHGQGLVDDLYNRFVELKFNIKRFIFITKGGCPLILNHTWDTQCIPSVQEKRMEYLLNQKEGIVIIVARFNLYLNGIGFDNLEGGKDPYPEYLRTNGDDLARTIEKISQKHKVILVYPIPEAGWHVPKYIKANMPKNFLKAKEYLKTHPLTTSLDVYKNRSKATFDALDSVQNKNIYRVYPHKIFCEEADDGNGRCKTHSSDLLYYQDYDHPSAEGARLVNNLILDDISEILHQKLN